MIVEELLATLGVKVDVEAFLEAEGLIGKLKMALGAVAVGLGLKELKEMVHSVAEVGDAAVKSSQKLGVGVEALQELGYAAKLSDLSQGQLEGALFKLSKGMEKFASTGKGPFGDALKKLGINFKDLKGESLDANLEVIADAFAKMPDGTAKAALAMKLFGGAGKAMIPFLNGGAAAIREQREEAQKLGIVIDTETAKKFEEFNDDQTRISEAWRGMKVQIVSGLLPSLHEMVTGILEWLKANGDWIKLGIHTALEVVITAFKIVGAVVSEAIDFTRALIHFFAEHAAVTQVLAGLLVAYLLPSIIAVTAAAWSAAAAFFVMNAPIILLIAAITSVVLLINHWGEIWPVVSEAGAKAFSFLWDKISAFLRGVKDGLLSAGKSVIDFFQNVGEAIADGIARAFDYLVDRAAKLGGDLWRSFKEIPVLGSLASAGEGVVDYLAGSPASTSALNQQTIALASAPSGGSIPTPQAGSLYATFGSTSVTVQTGPGLNEQQVADIAAQKVAQSQKTMLEDAHDALSGGRR